MSRDGGFATITIVIEQLLSCLNVSGGHQDQMWASIDGVKPGLTVPTFTVINQPSKATGFFCSINAVNTSNKIVKIIVT